MIQYYVEKDDRPGHEGEPIAVYRWVTGPPILLERFDAKRQEWVDDPSLLEATGIGGAESFWKASEKEARTALAALTGGETVRNW